MNIRGYIGRVLSYSVFRSGPFTYIHTYIPTESKKSPNLFRVWTSLQNYTKSERKSSESFFPSSSSSSSFIRRRERQRTHTKDFEASNTTTQKRVVDFDNAKQQKLEFSSSFVSSQKEFHALRSAKEHTTHYH